MKKEKINNSEIPRSLDKEDFKTNNLYHLLFEFGSLDDIIKISGMVVGLGTLRNSVYKYGSIYMLFAEPEKVKKEQVVVCTMNLSEFAQIQAVTKGQMIFIQEHSECILGEKALQQLSQIK